MRVDFHIARSTLWTARPTNGSKSGCSIRATTNTGRGMAPYQDDFSRINIPVLTLTGYYDDAQQSALWYLREHYKYNPRAEHYLVIGPYDHFTTDRARKDPELRGYNLDAAALLNTQELIFQWMDYVFRAGN